MKISAGVFSGQEADGHALKGKSAGGIVYGYDVAHEAGPNGLTERGGRKINEVQAKVVQRIFKAYANGESPAALAKTLNAKKVPAHNGGTWEPSTIYGNRERGTGILNNELYIGRQIWNRLRYIKNPETGKRVSHLNPKASQHLRAMIDKVVLTPKIAGEELTIDLICDLAGILSVATSSESARVAAELSKLQQVHQELSAKTQTAPRGGCVSASTSQVELKVLP
ncbi:recombinase family protein [Leisingera aquaemixtae]|uniref:recombinase family protein n=1 Tax=Leisingera aquaemixtae TaxID=1396826 RepID=UPI001C94962F|nr:recombinase family protein [Leisingera aquaemixtae]MBY6066605.1 recombinase family protein [Leisingera aquaemixtae]